MKTPWVFGIPGLRNLRSYERMAQRDYGCDYCDNPIFSGDTYCGSVYVSPKPLKKLGILSKLFVLKRHHFPPCDFDPDEEYKKSLDHDKNEEGISELAKAA